MLLEIGIITALERISMSGSHPYLVPFRHRAICSVCIFASHVVETPNVQPDRASESPALCPFHHQSFSPRSRLSMKSIGAGYKLPGPQPGAKHNFRTWPEPLAAVQQGPKDCR